MFEDYIYRFRKNIDSRALSAHVSIAIVAFLVYLHAENIQAEKGLSQYFDIYQTYGENVARMVIGQLSDIAGSVALAAGIAVVAEITFTLVESGIELADTYEEIRKKIHRVLAFALFAVLSTMTNLSVVRTETDKMMPGFVATDCGGPGSQCHGEMEDVLALATPSIALAAVPVVELARMRKPRKKTIRS